MSVRLTEFHRERIKGHAVAASFKKEEDALARREAKLCRAVYNVLFPAAVRKAAASAPKGWVDSASDFLFNAGGEHIRLKTDEPLLVPAAHTYGHGYVIKDPELAKEVRAFAREKEAVRTRKKQASGALAGMLASVSTIKKLAEVWPQGREFYKDISAMPLALPAIHVGEVNKLLNLKAA